MMKIFIKRIFPFVFLLVTSISFFIPFFLRGSLPIPADTIVGLYNPFRDLYAKDFPNGIPYKNALITDPVRQQYPWKSLAMTVTKEGRLPVWNPYTFSGTPLLANFQTGEFYPFNLLFFLLPFSYAWSFFIFLQPIFAGIFLYLYLKNLKLHSLPSLLGGVTFAFGGFSVAWLEWGNVIHTALWLPLVLLSIDRIFHFFAPNVHDKHQHFFLWYLVFLFSLVAAFFAGHLQTFFYLYMVSLIYFLSRWWQSKKNKTILFSFFALTVAFLLITIVQWWPTLQFILQSARDVDQNPFEKTGWFIPWQHLIQFISPDFFGNPTTLNYWGVWNYGEFIGYIGIAPLMLAALALCYRRDKKTIFFGILLVVSLLFALPTFLAKIPYWLNIPFLATAQPTRLLFVTDFSLVILAALGLDYLMRFKKKKQILIASSLVGSLFLLLWSFIFLGSKFFSLVNPEDLLVAKRNMYLPTILFIVFAGLFFVYGLSRNKKLQLVLLVTIISVCTVDLLRFGSKFIPFASSAYLFPSTKGLTYLQNQQGNFRIMSVDSQILPPNFSVMYKLQTIEGYDPLYLRRYGELLAAIGREKPDISTPFGFNRIITTQKFDSPLIDLLGVQYILSLADLKSSKLDKVFTEGQTRIYKNKNAFPRAFLVREIKPVTNKQSAIQALFDNRTDLKHTAIVEDPMQDTNFVDGTVKITHYSENKITVTTDGSGKKFLVLMDNFYPIWKAKICSEGEVNCDDTTIYRTNYTFRGVIIPPGKKSVLFYTTLL